MNPRAFRRILVIFVLNIILSGEIEEKNAT